MGGNEDRVQRRGHEADREEILLDERGPEQDIGQAQQQVNAQAEHMSRSPVGKCGAAKQQDSNDDRKRVGLEAADGVR